MSSREKVPLLEDGGSAGSDERASAPTGGRVKMVVVAVACLFVGALLGATAVEYRHSIKSMRLYRDCGSYRGCGCGGYCAPAGV